MKHNTRIVFCGYTRCKNTTCPNYSEIKKRHSFEFKDCMYHPNFKNKEHIKRIE